MLCRPSLLRHCTAMYTKSDSAIQLGSFLVDFLWMRCEQDLCESSCVEQADMDPGGIEVVEATS